MTIVDANILLYAYDTTSAGHDRAREWLEQALNGTEEVGLATVTLMAFLRIATSRVGLVHAMTVPEAVAIVRSWLERPNVRRLEPGAGHWTALESLARDADARGPLLMDAHIAALAKAHGATIATTDRDFRRFKGIRLLDPISA